MSEKENIVIEMKGVNKSFGKQRVLIDANLSILAGKVTVIVGASGQGKSVALKHMLGLIKADSGEVLIYGNDIKKMNKAELYHARMNFGALFQGAALFDSITVFENVALPLRERTKLSEKQIREKVLEKIDMVELEGSEDKYPAQLSGGMRKRVGLARALVLDPQILFLDEPTTGLDVKMSKEIYRLIYSLHNKFNFTSVIVSHDVPKIFKLADYVALMANSTVQGLMTQEDFQLSPNPVVKDFIEEIMGKIYNSGV
jgi:phospholipid/cholesterol/gamma-HCH transport system ATP-binding protein